MQQTVRAMLAHSQGGTLLVTGATSATRGSKNFAAFAAGKHGSRAMTQSVAREFGPRGIHVRPLWMLHSC
jgi:NAD(P)-dependent dehydrogenase (short-subunit alcohol dehydrogenase family)